MRSRFVRAFGKKITVTWEANMKMNKVGGAWLLILAVATIVGMFIDNYYYWITYNVVTIILGVMCGIALLKEK